jgi:hypothetical protein
MFHPVGSRPPSVYWRRRLVLLGALVVLAALTAWVLRPGADKDEKAASGTGHPQTTSPNAAHVSLPPSTTQPTTTQATTPKSSTTKSAGAAPCDQSKLKVAAVVSAPTFHVGDQPTLLLQVMNTGTVPCVQDLADSQVEMRVYNGESRVWGSHDCEIQPGTDARTLAVGQAVRVSIVWSGLSSQPKCAGTRQRVGAGTYTLYALLSGHTGTAAQFAIS